MGADLPEGSLPVGKKEYEHWSKKAMPTSRQSSRIL